MGYIYGSGRPKKSEARERRDKKLCIRISMDDLERLNAICSTYGITKTDYILSTIAADAERIKRGSKNERER